MEQLKMPNKTVPAAATGLPEETQTLGRKTTVSRREIFAPAAAASVAALFATPSIAASAVANPELLALDSELTAAMEHHRVVVDGAGEAEERFQAVCPTFPPELDVESMLNPLWNGKCMRYRAEDLETMIANPPLTIEVFIGKEQVLVPDERRRQRAKVLLPMAQKYEEDYERAETESGYKGAMERLRASYDRLDALSERIKAITPKNFYDLAILANLLKRGIARDLWEEPNGYLDDEVMQLRNFVDFFLGCTGGANV
jgi:hypothetical protein